MGCSPWGRKESDMTERLHFLFSLSGIGEGIGNPLQFSCLENPTDGEAWWAAIYGVSQSQTRLKRLSSSSKGNFLNCFDVSKQNGDIWVHLGWRFYKVCTLKVECNKFRTAQEDCEEEYDTGYLI